MTRQAIPSWISFRINPRSITRRFSVPIQQFFETPTHASGSLPGIPRISLFPHDILKTDGFPCFIGHSSSSPFGMACKDRDLYISIAKTDELYVFLVEKVYISSPSSMIITSEALTSSLSPEKFVFTEQTTHTHTDGELLLGGSLCASVFREHPCDRLVFHHQTHEEDVAPRPAQGSPALPQDAPVPLGSQPFP